MGAPYFDRMTMPIVVCLLFLMAVAPVLPWRKASAELLRHRLLSRPRSRWRRLVVCVVGGVRGLNPLLAFGLGAFAGASALRQLVLGHPPPGLRGFVGRANGGMIVHLGVVLIAVAFAASHSFAQQAQLTLQPGPDRLLRRPHASPTSASERRDRRDPHRPSRPGSGWTAARCTRRRSATTRSPARRSARRRSKAARSRTST